MRIRSKYLPKIYQELEYVEANRQAGQHIVVDYIPTSADSIELDFVLTNNTVTSTLWCARYGTTNRTLTAFWIANTSIRCDYNSSQTNMGSINVGQRYTLSYAKGVWKLDGITKLSKTYSNFTAQAISLFASYQNSPASVSDNQSYMKLYHFRVTSENGTPQADLIPCRRLTDNKVGLYNAVTKVFLTPASKDLIAGPARNTHTFMPRLPSLPQEYQQVEYIRNSNGGQYIDTGWMPNYQTGFEVKMVYSPSVLAKRYCLMSNYNQGSAQLSLELRANNKARFWLYNGSTDIDSSATITTGINTSIFKYENTRWTFTTNGVTTTGTRAATADDSTASMWLFLDRAKRTSTFPSPISIYSCEIRQGGVLIHNFIPCRRKSDDAYGMYDMVTKVFRGNLGTGAFTGGSDVINLLNIHICLQRLPSEYQEVEYIYQEKQSGSGTSKLAFIQSNLSFSDIDAIEFDLAISSEGGAQNNIVLCAYNTSYYIIIDKTTHRVNGFSSSTWSPTSTTLFTDELRHKVKVSGLESSNTTKIRTAWDWTWWHKTKWYGLKLYKNNTLIQNFVPCYRKSDNVIGMYDLVGKQFYTNAGTGTFLKGSNVTNII